MNFDPREDWRFMVKVMTIFALTLYVPAIVAGAILAAVWLFG